MKNTNFQSIAPVIPFLFYVIAIAIGFNWQADSSALSQVNCFASDLCTQVPNQNSVNRKKN